MKDYTGLEFFYESYPFLDLCNDLKNIDTFQIATDIIDNCKKKWDLNPTVQIYNPICINHQRYEAYENIPYRKLSQRTRLFMAVDYAFRNDSRSCLNRNLYWDVLWSSIDDRTYKFERFPDIPAMYDGALKIHRRVIWQYHSNPYKWEREYPKRTPIQDPKGKKFQVDSSFEYFLPPISQEENFSSPFLKESAIEDPLRFLRDEINRLDMMSYMDTV